MKFSKYYLVIREAWTIETAYEGDRTKWSTQNPDAGQCAITALLVHDYFGGEIYTGMAHQGKRHFWNVVNGHVIDLTKSQFDGEVKFNRITTKDPEKLLRIKDVQHRYLLLKENFAKKQQNKEEYYGNNLRHRT